MTDARPHLVALDPDATPPEAGGAPAPAPSEGPPALGRYGWVAAALALVCAIGWGVMANRASQLEGELAASQAALAAAEGRIEDYQAHLGQVRERTEGLVAGMDALVGQLGSLATDLESLGGLVGDDPTAAGNEPGEAPAGP